MKQLSQKKLIEYLQLQSSLSQFGLSPNDWDIIPKRNDFILIKNKTESDFYFIGKTMRKKNSQNIDWKFITLAGL